MKCTDIREVEMTEPEVAEAFAVDESAILAVHDYDSHIYIRCTNLVLAEAAAAAINAAIGAKP